MIPAHGMWSPTQKVLIFSDLGDQLSTAFWSRKSQVAAAARYIFEMSVVFWDCQMIKNISQGHCGFI